MDNNADKYGTRFREEMKKSMSEPAKYPTKYEVEHRGEQRKAIRRIEEPYTVNGWHLAGVMIAIIVLGVGAVYLYNYLAGFPR